MSGGTDAGVSGLERASARIVDKPRLLDLFCGAGGAAMGYHHAGFEVTGIDIKPQPNYPFEFEQADALAFMRDRCWEGFDVIHASPPCQRYSTATPEANRNNHPDLVAPTREALRKTGLPYIIENVVGAPLESPVMLCGGALGLILDEHQQMHRHRLFESNVFLMSAGCSRVRREAITIAGHGTPGYKANGKGRRMNTVAERRKVMEIDWTDRGELSQAIPPAMTKYLGLQLLDYLRTADFCPPPQNTLNFSGSLYEGKT